jgi:hypothetical protein
MSDNVAARSKSSVVSPGGAVVHVLGVVGVVGAVCAPSGNAAEHAISRIAAVTIDSIRFQSFMIISPHFYKTAHFGTLTSDCWSGRATGSGCYSMAKARRGTKKTRNGAEFNSPEAALRTLDAVRALVFQAIAHYIQKDNC